LLKEDADVNATTNLNETALHLIAGKGGQFLEEKSS
jgi:hypothetical protein